MTPPIGSPKTIRESPLVSLNCKIRQTRLGTVALVVVVVGGVAAMGLDLISASSLSTAHVSPTVVPPSFPSLSPSLSASELSSTLNQTAGWQMFDGDGFNFRYPQGMTLERESASLTVGTLPIMGGSVQFGTLHSQLFPFGKPQEGKIYKDFSESTAVSDVEKHGIKVGNKEARLYSVSAPDQYVDFIYFEQHGRYYEIQFDIAGGGLPRTEQLILSTFEFIN